MDNIVPSTATSTNTVAVDTSDILIDTMLHPSVRQYDGTYAPEVIRVQGRGAHQGDAPFIHVGLAEDYGVDFTVSEARQVAAAIIALADGIEAGR